MKRLACCRHRTEENSLKLRLMRFMLADELMDVTDDEEQLREALLPLVHNRDGHFLATLSALLLSLLEGKTDCPISGVFGAGKTRAAAAIIAGLITVNPSLKIMILTKENVASQSLCLCETHYWALAA